MNLTDQDMNTGSDTVEEADGERRVVLFDMDGVLIEGRSTDSVVHERALDDALTDYGLEATEETRTLLSGYEYDVEFVRGCQRLNIDPTDFYELRDQYSEQRIINRLESETRITYEDVSALASLSDQYPLGVVSNNYDAVVEFVVDSFGLDMFDHVRGRAPGVRGFYRRKPDPHLLLDAIDALDAVNGLYAGDRPTDVLAATRAGLDAAFIKRPHNDDATHAVTPAIEVDSLIKLTDRLKNGQWPLWPFGMD